MVTEAVAVVLDDVLYPLATYRQGACGIGARLIKRYCGLDIADGLNDYYVPGEEDLAVRAALEEHLQQVDDRWISKAASAMAAYRPRVGPYSDAMEVFPVLQGMGVRLGLMGDGPPLAQRLIAESLQADTIFQYQVWLRELRGTDTWNEALQLMELMLDCPLDQLVVVCAHLQQAEKLARIVGRCYCVMRPPYEPDMPPPSSSEVRYIPMVNLYELPEALGWFTPSPS